jgi:uncharacterized membrane protein YhhN
MNLFIVVGAFFLSGALAIFGSEMNVFLIQAIFKTLTTVLLFAVVGWPRSTFSSLVVAGVCFSLVGDVALLSDSDMLFVIGLGGFLLAHVCYTLAFLTKVVWSPRMLLYAGIVGGISILLVHTVMQGAQGLLLPVMIYAIAISAMVVAAFSTLGGKLPYAQLAAAGAAFFYISDSSLALNRFVHSIPHVAFLTLGVYWLGQLGIALSARAEAGYSPFKELASPSLLPVMVREG